MTVDLARPRGRRLVAVAVAVVALLAVSCGDDDDNAATGDTGAPSTEGAAGPGDTAAPEGPIDVVAIDYAYQNLPESVPAGTEFTLENRSSEEVHEVVAFRLPDDEQRSVEELLQLGEEEFQQIVAGPPAMVAVAPPNAEGFVPVGDGTLTEPGRYAFICTIPVGADPQAYLEAAQQSQGGPVDVPGGPPHFVEGMFGEVTVGS